MKNDVIYIGTCEKVTVTKKDIAVKKGKLAVVTAAPVVNEVQLSCFTTKAAVSHNSTIELELHMVKVTAPEQTIREHGLWNSRFSDPDEPHKPEKIEYVDVWYPYFVKCKRWYREKIVGSDDYILSRGLPFTHSAGIQYWSAAEGDLCLGRRYPEFCARAIDAVKFYPDFNAKNVKTYVDKYGDAFNRLIQTFGSPEEARRIAENELADNSAWRYSISVTLGAALRQNVRGTHLVFGNENSMPQSIATEDQVKYMTEIYKQVAESPQIIYNNLPIDQELLQHYEDLIEESIFG